MQYSIPLCDPALLAISGQAVVFKNPAGIGTMMDEGLLVALIPAYPPGDDLSVQVQICTLLHLSVHVYI